MKRLNKREFKQVASNLSSDIDSKDYESLENIYCKAIFVLVIDDTLAKNPLKRI